MIWYYLFSELIYFRMLSVSLVEDIDPIMSRIRSHFVLATWKVEKMHALVTLAVHLFA